MGREKKMNFHISENQDLVFSRDEATLYERVSVRWLVGPLVGWSVGWLVRWSVGP